MEFIARMPFNSVKSNPSFLVSPLFVGKSPEHEERTDLCEDDRAYYVDVCDDQKLLAECVVGLAVGDCEGEGW